MYFWIAKNGISRCRIYMKIYCSYHRQLRRIFKTSFSEKEMPLNLKEKTIYKYL